MATSPDHEPPAAVSYDLTEALDLLAALEDAWEVLAHGDHLAVLAEVELQIMILNRRLGLEPPGGADAH